MRVGTAIKQCGYHFGMPTQCRMVQLTHRPGCGEWQAPKWVCAPCRRYLRGLFRYYIMPVPEHTPAEINQALEFFGLRAVESPTESAP